MESCRPEALIQWRLRRAEAKLLPCRARPPKRAADIADHLPRCLARRRNLSCCPEAHRDGAALHLARADGNARCRLDHAAAWLHRRGAQFHRAARGLDRGAPATPAGAHAFRRRRGCADPRRQPSHRRTAAAARQRLDRTGCQGCGRRHPAAALRQGRSRTMSRGA